MDKCEKCSVLSLSLILSSRMFGLFLVLPVLSLYALGLHGGDSLVWVGFALGAYGLTQAIFQIPMGWLSDIWGRKLIIFIGLCLLLLGSVICALSESVTGIIVGRAIQGAGAFSAALLALLSDLISERNYTRAMACIGMSIGLAFMLSLVAAPLLLGSVGVPGMFWGIFLFGLFALWILWRWVPSPTPSIQAQHIFSKEAFKQALWDKRLWFFNGSIFLLHMSLVMLWIGVPSSLERSGLPAQNHWWVYLVAVVGSFVIVAPVLFWLERLRKTKLTFILSVLFLWLGELILFAASDGLWGVCLGLSLFFMGFNALEMLLPSLVSKVASKQRKGMCMGVYNTCQFLGISLGGILAGIIQQHFGISFVFLCFSVPVLIWLFWATFCFPKDLKNT